MEKLLVGKVLKPQGIKGEVKIAPLTNAPEKFYDYKKLFLGKAEEEFFVETVDVRFGIVYIKFKGVDDRNMAELLRGYAVKIEKDNFGNLKDDEYLLEDLIGCHCFDEQGREVGVIEDIDQFGSADVISVRERGMLFSVSFLKDIFVDIDVRSKHIVINKKIYDEVKLCD